MTATAGGKLIVGARRALERIAQLEHKDPGPTRPPWAWFLEAELRPCASHPNGGTLRAWTWGAADFRAIESKLGEGAVIRRLVLAHPRGVTKPPPEAPLLATEKGPSALDVVLSVDLDGGLPWPQDAGMIAQGREELIRAGAHLARTTEACSAYEALRVTLWAALDREEIHGPAVAELRAGLAFIDQKERARLARQIPGAEDL